MLTIQQVPCAFEGRVVMGPKACCPPSESNEAASLAEPLPSGNPDEWNPSLQNRAVLSCPGLHTVVGKWTKTSPRFARARPKSGVETKRVDLSKIESESGAKALMPGVAKSGPFSKLMAGGRIFWHWAVRRSEVLPYPPVEISIEPTNRCNFACQFCPQSSPSHFDQIPASAIQPDGVEVLLGKIRNSGVKSDLLHWTLDGEPFMNKRFHENLAVARDFGFSKHHFATNGMLLTLDRLSRLPSEGMSYVMTPDFCSDEAYFEQVRGTPGSWKTVRDNLIAAIEDPSLAHIQFKITDISSYRFNDPQDLDRRFDELQSIFPKSDRVSFHRRVFHNASGKLDSRLSSKEGYRVCPYPWYTFFIAHNGDVVACCRDLEHQSVLGNLFEQELMEIWNGEKYQAMRRDLAGKRPECQSACDGCDMPYDAAKFSLRNFVKTALHRMLILSR